MTTTESNRVEDRRGTSIEVYRRDSGTVIVCVERARSPRTPWVLVLTAEQARVLAGALTAMAATGEPGRKEVPG